jgi:hypothetical protein
MSDSRIWLVTEEFAAMAGISPQAANKAIRASQRGLPWRGCILAVRQRVGRGGRSGLVNEIALDSLPAMLRTDDEDGSAPDRGDPAPPPSNPPGSVAAYRWEAIREAISCPHGSAERSETVAHAASREGKSVRTLYRWIKAYEAQGVRGLCSVRPSNSGQRRVAVSRAFDRAALAANLDPLLLVKIGEELERSLKGLWASRAEAAGWREVRRLAQALLRGSCEARALSLPADAFHLSRRRVEAFAPFRVVNQRRNDRKAFDDAKPRIRRDWTGLAPMERVVGDVKHLDVIVRRPDRTMAWPKIVAFLDAGTNRIFVHPVLLGQGEGVRQEHVIEAFLAMVCDPNWGFPKGLYLDNGAEFAALTRIQGALGSINEPGARTIIFARPYNASAKPIESMFARLDRYVFSLLPGYAGPNRMAKKTQRVGKAPDAFPGDWDEFCSVVIGLVADHNTRPIGGLWRDRSPCDWLEAKRAEGWQPATVDPVALDAAFCDHDSRRIDRGILKIRGQRFHDPGISALPGRTAVDIALPWRRDARPLAKVPSGPWVRLSPDVPFPARWIEGARETGQRQKAQSRYVAQLAREAPKLDPIGIKLRSVAQATPAFPTGRLGNGMDLGAQAEHLAEALRAPSPPDPVSARERRRLREMELTERLERRRRGDD